MARLHTHHGRCRVLEKVWLQFNHREAETLRSQTATDYANIHRKVFLLPKMQQTEVTWDREDFIVGYRTPPYFEKTFIGYSFGHFTIATWVAKQWGFLSEDESKLGPNISFERFTKDITETWPKVVQMRDDGVSAAVNNILEWQGPAYAYGTGVDVLLHPQLWKVSQGWMRLSRGVKWRFTGLEHSYE